MTEPFLIAHKVRGEPAFDIAHQMECPECKGAAGPTHTFTCNECDSTGYWWIVSTSGHRAYPYWHANLRIGDYPSLHNFNYLPEAIPPDLPDHYPTRAAPTISLAEALGFTSKPKPQETASPFPRRL